MNDIVQLKQDQNGIATITMNQPERLNAISREMVKGLKQAFLQVSADKNVKVVVLTGAGRAFCAGADLTMLDGTISPKEGKDLPLEVSEITKIIYNLEKPVIAAVNGFCMGGGLEYAMACDFIISSPKSKFAQATIKIGLVPDLGASYLLPRAVGVQKARELIYTGKTIDAMEAERIGLILKVVEEETFEDSIEEFALELAQGPSITMGLAKLMVNRNSSKTLEESLENEAWAQSICFQNNDYLEGLQAFKEKRAPIFTGE